MLLLLLEPPGRRSWENTESGSGSLRPDLNLWTPEGLQGPSGFRRIIHKLWSRLEPQVGTQSLFPTDTTDVGLDLLLPVYVLHNMTVDLSEYNKYQIQIAFYKSLYILVDI